MANEPHPPNTYEETVHRQITELEAALEEQWAAAHAEYCGQPHGQEKACMWERPAVLDAYKPVMLPGRER